MESEGVTVIVELFRAMVDATLERVPLENAVSALVIVVVFGSMLFLEWQARLRPLVESKLRRIVRNLSTGGISLALLSPLQVVIVLPVAVWVVREQIGLLGVVSWPSGVETLVGVLLLDYTLWWWHWASHRNPFLWRFHLVHHVDRDLDSSTALRFHFGELALSVVYRAVQIVVIGVDVRALWIWQTILFAMILFHHANIRMPLALERVLVKLVVTPRMHAIHHSDRQDETNSNWSSILSCWDYLHRTILLDVAQKEIRIGVPAFQETDDVTFRKINLLPFGRQKEDWRLPDGSISVRGHTQPTTRLAE